jgi:hypothetical protein
MIICHQKSRRHKHCHFTFTFYFAMTAASTLATLRIWTQEQNSMKTAKAQNTQNLIDLKGLHMLKC